MGLIRVGSDAASSTVTFRDRERVVAKTSRTHARLNQDQKEEEEKCMYRDMVV